MKYRNGRMEGSGCTKKQVFIFSLRQLPKYPGTQHRGRTSAPRTSGMNILGVEIKNIKSAIRMNRRYIPVFLLHKGEQQLASDLSQISRQYKVEILGAHSGVVKKFTNGPCCRRGKCQENTIIFSGIYAGFGTSKTGAAMGGLMLNIDRLDYTALSYLSLKFFNFSRFTQKSFICFCKRYLFLLLPHEACFYPTKTLLCR